MIAATLRLLFCLVLIGILPARAWACADMAVRAQAAALQPAAAAAAPAVTAAATDQPGYANLGAIVAPPRPAAVCESCQYCPQCHTPALTPAWHLSLARAEPLPIRQEAAARFASITPTPRLKPPIS